MRNFIYFLVNHSTTLLFIALEVICAIAIVSYNDYQRSAFMSSSNALAGGIYNTQDAISKYFSLDDENRALARENIQLRNRIAQLEKGLHSFSDSVRTIIEDEKPRYIYRSAHVINSTVNRSRNYLTIDEGTKHGIMPDMVAINDLGVVGIVTAASENYATILPIINTSFHLSVKVASSQFKGQMIWNGVSPDYAHMIDVPEHAVVAVGDTIVTSGSSSYFSEGLNVGIVEEIENDKNGGFFRLKVNLAVDFHSIYDVEIIENLELKEQQELENLNEND